MSNEEPEVPDVILDPPEKYDKIKNKHGCCGVKPNLYYNGTVHRIWVRHAVRGAHEIGLDEYVEMYCHDGKPFLQAAEEMREAVEQALEFYEEYPEAFAALNKLEAEKMMGVREESLKPEDVDNE